PPSTAPVAKSPSQNRARNPIRPAAHLNARFASHTFGRCRWRHQRMPRRNGRTQRSRHGHHSPACFRFTIPRPFPLVAVGPRTRNQEPGAPAMNPANLPFDSEAMLQGLRSWVECESPTWDAGAVERMLDLAAREMAIMGASIERIAGRQGF